jgi:hypothetical protein
MSIFDWFKNLAEKKQSDNPTEQVNQPQNNVDDTVAAPKKDRLAFLKSTPTTLNDSGQEVPAEGAAAKWDVHKILPLILPLMATSLPEAGGTLLNAYNAGRQQELDRQKEDAWKQWEIKAKQKRQALEDERYKIEHPTYTVPTTADLAKNSPIDYGQYVQNPMTTGFKLDGGYKPEDKLQEQINNLGKVDFQGNNAIPFLNFDQQEQRQMPSLSPDAPELPETNPYLKGMEGKQMRRGDYLEAEEKWKKEKEATAQLNWQKAKFQEYYNSLPEDSRYKEEFKDAVQNPQNYNLADMQKLFYSETAPKQQPMNWKGIGLTKEWETTFANNPSMATPEMLAKAIADIKDPADQQKALLELENKGLANDKLRAEIEKIKKATAGKNGRGGSGMDADLKRQYDGVLKAYDAYYKNVHDRQKEYGGKPTPLKLEDWIRQPGREGLLATYNQATESNLKTLPAPYSINPNKPRTVKPQPKGIKIGGKSVTPMVANEIKTVMKGNDMNKFNQLVKKYKLDRDALIDWYAKNK